jgi:hypothetical protein
MKAETKKPREFARDLDQTYDHIYKLIDRATQGVEFLRNHNASLNSLAIRDLQSKEEILLMVARFIELGEGDFEEAK